ncbi:hypothetical protein [Marinobacter sp. X15-166B]|uniref:hypothetical protein n=1 Tax=Marinobacter sp. X15-166B TaxID=1897620 RepID=UPI00085C6CCF|nr:hypothetical protein [Marinobacter sp. X15-166B]OEY67601.1 hypothetical protein BG841_14945 [Marinobacter sp. X15-166B]
MSKRALFAGCVMLGLLALAVLGPRWLMSSSGSGGPGTLEHCDLLTTGCEWQSGHHWSVDMKPSGQNSGGETYQLTVTTSANPQRLIGVLRGESMYLGEYPVVLKKTAKADTWVANFTAPYCTEDPGMIWRIDLQDGAQPLHSGPFKLTFQAAGRLR